MQVGASAASPAAASRGIGHEKVKRFGHLDHPAPVLSSCTNLAARRQGPGRAFANPPSKPSTLSAIFLMSIYRASLSFFLHYKTLTSTEPTELTGRRTKRSEQWKKEIHGTLGCSKL
jgi:hypothetical protein